MLNLSERDVRTAIQELEVAWRALDGADAHTFESALGEVAHALDEVATREVLGDLPPVEFDVEAWVEQRNREYTSPLQLPAMGIAHRTAFSVALLRHIEQTPEDRRMGRVIAVAGVNGGYAGTIERFNRVIVRPFVDEVRRRLVALLPEPAPSASGGTTVYNVSGSNARVNVNSADSSVNVVSVDRRQLFDAMRHVAEGAPIEATVKTELLDRIRALEAAQAGPSFVRRYSELIGTISDHAGVIALFAPYFPALAQLLNAGGP